MYQFLYIVYDAANDAQTALLHALDIIETASDKNDDKLYFPIIFGAPWSSISIAIAPLLSAFNMGQISSSATSIALSDINRYPYFHRSVLFCLS